MNESEKSQAREFAWKYFEYHAEQRLKTFNFYLVISAFIVGGYITFLERAQHSDSSYFLWAIPLVHSFLSFVFWRLDKRNSNLVKNGENALRYLDSKWPVEANDPDASLLRMFESDDKSMRSEKLVPGLGGKLSYSACFRLVFGIFGFASFAVAVKQICA